MKKMLKIKKYKYLSLNLLKIGYKKTMKLNLKLFIFVIVVSFNCNIIFSNDTLNYEEPVFEQFVFDEKEGISFKKIVETHNMYEESKVVLSESEPFVYGSEFQNNDNEEEVIESSSSEMSSSSSSSGGSSFSSMSNTSSQSEQSSDQSDLYFFMNAYQYDEGNGVRQELMYSINE